MKHFILITLLASLAGAQDIVTPAGRTQWGDTVRWGDSDDSTSYLRVRGNVVARDSSSSWVAITTDSCSLPVRLERGSQMPSGKLELSYEVRTSSGNTDSSQVKWRVDSRYCRGTGAGQTCDSWAPAGRFRGDTASYVQDSIVSVATASGVTWVPTRQVFDVPGGHQIRLCVDSYQAGGQATDTTYFRRHIVRTSSIPAGGVPPGGAGSVTIGTFPDNEPFNVAQWNGTTATSGAGAVTAGTPRVTHASDDPVTTAVQIMDDWDETDRAKVNPIAGQAGVQGASGTVNALTQRVVLATDVGLPAGTSLLGRVSGSSETSTIYNGATALTPKWAVIDHATSGDNTLVAAVASNHIRVVALYLVSAGTVNVRFEDGASGTALSGQMNLVANSGFTLPYNPAGWFQTSINTLLNLELSGAISVDGTLQYIEVP